LSASAELLVLSVLLFIRATLCVLLVYVGMCFCLLVVLVKLSVLAKWFLGTWFRLFSVLFYCFM